MRISCTRRRTTLILIKKTFYLSSLIWLFTSHVFMFLLFCVIFLCKYNMTVYFLWGISYFSVYPWIVGYFAVCVSSDKYQKKSLAYYEGVWSFGKCSKLFNVKTSYFLANLFFVVEYFNLGNLQKEWQLKLVTWVSFTAS